jgi:hypothetical protein
VVDQAGGPVRHYTLSSADGAMSPAAAAAVARVILELGHGSRPGELIPGGRETFHLLVPLPHADDRPGYGA